MRIRLISRKRDDDDYYDYYDSYYRCSLAMYLRSDVHEHYERDPDPQTISIRE